MCVELLTSATNRDKRGKMDQKTVIFFFQDEFSLSLLPPVSTTDKRKRERENKSKSGGA